MTCLRVYSCPSINNTPKHNLQFTLFSLQMIIRLLSVVLAMLSAVSAGSVGLITSSSGNVLLKTPSPNGAFLFNGRDILAEFTRMQTMLVSLQEQLTSSYATKVRSVCVTVLNLLASKS